MIRKLYLFSLVLPVFVNLQCTVNPPAAGNAETAAVETTNTTTDSGFALMEIFTSEGCSSCPPAYNVVRKILEEYEGREVYLLDYHVDYFNKGGWEDPYSKAEFSNRQRKYVRNINAPGMYTPQMIVNGQTQLVASDSTDAWTEVANALKTAKSYNLAVGTSNCSSDSICVTYKINPVPAGSYLMFALIEEVATQEIKSGENQGRKLTHYNVVKQLEGMEINRSSGSYTMAKEKGSGAHSVVVFVQDPARMRIMAVKSVKI